MSKKKSRSHIILNPVKKHGVDIDLDPSERELFLSAFYQGDSEPIDYNQEQAEARTVKQDIEYSSGSVRLSKEERDLFLRAVEQGWSCSIEPPMLKPRIERPVEPSLLKRDRVPAKLASRRNTIDAKIDLHGLFAEEALNRLARFLTHEKSRGSRILLVVHGKGSGILKKAVWALLENHDLVASFQIAPPKHGGHGAVILRLKHKKLSN